jgi:transposase
VGHIQGANCHEVLRFHERLDDYIAEDNPVRFLEAFVDELDLEACGFRRAVPAATGRPGYAPGDLLKLYLYGYLYRLHSSRRLAQETQRHVELRWLLKQLRPDHQTVANCRTHNLKHRKLRYEGFQAQLLSHGQEQLSLTDPESRALTRGKGRGTEVCYNVQTAVDAKHKRIVAREVTNEPGDRDGLSPLALQAKDVLACRFDAVADMGYYHGHEVKACLEAGSTPYVSRPITSAHGKLGLCSTDDWRRIEFRRIVVTDKGKGYGRAAVRAIKRQMSQSRRRGHERWMSRKGVATKAR